MDRFERFENLSLRVDRHESGASDGGDGVIRCRAAESRADFEHAFRLVYQRYVTVGLIRANPLGLRIAPQQLRPECQVVLAEVDDRVVGTVSLVGDGQSGLPVDSVFPGVLDPLRRAGRRIVEIGCLASTDDSARFPSRVYIELTRATIHSARQNGFDLMVASVHPRHAKFYERAMGFDRVSAEAPYEMVNGNPAICLAGSPTDASAYRQPWRRHFFEESPPAHFQNQPGMNPFDRQHFTQLFAIVDDTRHDVGRRAA